MLRRESFPPVDFGRAKITTFYPGSSPEEVEEKITNRIEEELRSVQGVKDVRSLSQSGLSEISVRIDIDGANTKVVVDELQRALQRVQKLPTDLPEDPEFLEINAKEIPVLELAVEGPNINRQRDQFAKPHKDLIEDNKNVAEVRMGGFREKEFQVLLDPRKMARQRVGVPEVLDAIARRSQNIPAGYLRKGRDLRLVRALGETRTVEEIENIPIRMSESLTGLRVKDVARVVEGQEEAQTLARLNGKEATVLTITKKEGSDTLKINKGLYEQLDTFRKKLPADFNVVIYNDESKRVAESLDITIGNASQGLLIVIVVLLLFLPGWLGILTAISLPVSLFASAGMMHAAGATFNRMTMLGLIIALGMLVDNSVVVSEHYAALREKGIKVRDAAIQAAHQFWIAITASVMTTIAAFLPMLVTTGVMGQFIQWIPIVVTIALLICLLESLVLLPARLQFVLRKEGIQNKRLENRTRGFDRVRKFASPLIAFAIRRRYVFLMGLVALFVFSGLLTRYGNRFELFPPEAVEQYIARVELPLNTNIETTDKYVADLSNKAAAMMPKGVVDYIIGRAGIIQVGPNDPGAKTGENVGMLIIVVPRAKASDLNFREILATLRTIDRGEAEVLTFESVRNGPPVGKPLTVALRSNNYPELRGLADEILSFISTIDGVLDPQDDEIRGSPEFRILMDFEKLAAARLDLQTVGLNIRTALQGTVATSLTENGDDVDLRVRFDDVDRGSIEQLEALNIKNPLGNIVPLASLSKTVDDRSPSTRKHFDFKRSISVTAEVDPQKITSVELNARVAEFVKKTSKDFPSVSTVFGGEQESTAESLSSLVTALGLAFFGILAILVFMFSSYLKPFLVLTTIPLGLIGVLIAFFIHQRPISFLAMIGIIGLLGVVVNSAIILLDHIQFLRETNPERPLADILHEAAVNRLRPVLVTSITTVGGLFPTAYGIGGYDPMLVPMTLALGWGLVSATLLTIFWIPSGYMILEDLSRLVSRRKSPGEVL